MRGVGRRLSSAATAAPPSVTSIRVFVLFPVVPASTTAAIVSDPVVKDVVVAKRTAAVKNTAAEPLGVCKVRPEAIAPLGIVKPAAVTVAADAFFWNKRVIRVAAVKARIS